MKVLLLLGWLAAVASAHARVVAKLQVNGPVTNSTARIEVTGGPIIYIDPVQLTATTADADFILITHNHGDHQSLPDINRIRKPGTVIYSSAPGVPALITGLPGVTINAVAPGQKLVLGGVEVEAVPMYNLVKTGHPRAMNFVGYVLNLGGVRLYAAGDTERIPEMKNIAADIALLPLGQTFTMTPCRRRPTPRSTCGRAWRFPITMREARARSPTRARSPRCSMAACRCCRPPGRTFRDRSFRDDRNRGASGEHHGGAGGGATLSVQATGAGALRYQWRRNGVMLAGATNATLPITAAASANAGDYESLSPTTTARS